MYRADWNDMTRFLGSENFALASVHRLRDAGHGVEAVIEDPPGAKDREALASADRVLEESGDPSRLLENRRTGCWCGGGCTMGYYGSLGTLSDMSGAVRLQARHCDCCVVTRCRSGSTVSERCRKAAGSKAKRP